jgi:hypothetical protein
MGFLKRADRRRYGALWSELENNYTRGLDQFPADMTGMYHLLLSYQPAPTGRQETTATEMHPMKKPPPCPSYRTATLLPARTARNIAASNVSIVTSLAIMPVLVPETSPSQLKAPRCCR